MDFKEWHTRFELTTKMYPGSKDAWNHQQALIDTLQKDIKRLIGIIEEGLGPEDLVQPSRNPDNN